MLGKEKRPQKGKESRQRKKQANPQKQRQGEQGASDLKSQRFESLRFQLQFL